MWRAFRDWVFRPSTVVLARRVDAILARQAGDGATKSAEAWCWHDTGLCVSEATNAASAAIRQVPLSLEPAAYVEALGEALAAAHDRYRSGANDPDGYGSATFHEIRRDVAALRPPR